MGPRHSLVNNKAKRLERTRRNAASGFLDSSNRPNEGIALADRP